jgi:hypothetical protein
MIFESYPWKMELRGHLKSFKTWEKNYIRKKAGFTLKEVFSYRRSLFAS